jgi:GxxExxY protein
VINHRGTETLRNRITVIGSRFSRWEKRGCRLRTPVAFTVPKFACNAPLPADAEQTLTRQIISAAIDVHRALGPGLLESAYQACLSHELRLQQLGFRQQVELPLIYKDVKLDCGYRIDFVVEGKVVVEIKAIEGILPVHEAQLLTYLRLSGLRVGLLINFNVPVLKDGIRRRVL